jgi:glycosyltransferase involved in cell wall biosynthesis
MKIALDATPLTIPTGGVRRYTEELSLALAENFPEDDFWLLSDRSFGRPSSLATNLKVGPGPRNVVERRWWLWGLRGEMARLGIDVFHGTDFAVPYLPIRPAVMTLHDLSPWMDPSWHANSNRVRTRTPLLLRLGLATLVITPSEAVRKQAIERFALGADRVAVVPLAPARLLRPQTAQPQDPPYLLYVGTLEPRKNLNLLLDTWRELRREYAIDLVLAGRRRADFPQIAPEPGLHLPGPVPEEDLARLYSGALACVYPSYYEGFGLPVLEAMQCGAVVIASRDAAVSEVAGDGALLLDITDRRAWIEAFRSVAVQPEGFDALRQRAIARAAEFSWTKTAQLTRNIYAHAVERFRKKA